MLYFIQLKLNETKQYNRSLAAEGREGYVLMLYFVRQKFYETKQYKKGLKAADSILKKIPDHGRER